MIDRLVDRGVIMDIVVSFAMDRLHFTRAISIPPAEVMRRMSASCSSLVVMIHLALGGDFCRAVNCSSYILVSLYLIENLDLDLVP